MPRQRTREDIYDSCLAEGMLRNIDEVNRERIKSMMQNADTSLDSAKTLSKSLPNNDRRWMNVYTLHYDALHLYTEALLMFSRVVSENHQCLFAALCAKRPDLELEWDFFERIRTARNGINYYGKYVGFKEWKEVEVQFTVYLSTLKNAIEKEFQSETVLT